MSKRGKMSKIRALLGNSDANSSDVTSRLVTQGRTEMNVGDYGSFWKRIFSAPTFTATLVAAIVDFLLSREEGKVLARLNLDQMPMKEFELLMRHTLMLLDAFANVDPREASYQNSFQRYRRLADAGGIAFSSSPAFNVLQSFERRYLANHASITIPKLIVECTMISKVDSIIMNPPEPAVVVQPVSPGRAVDRRNRKKITNSRRNTHDPARRNTHDTAAATLPAPVSGPRTPFEECREDYPFDFHKLMIILRRTSIGSRLPAPRSEPLALLDHAISMGVTPTGAAAHSTNGGWTTSIFDELVKLLGKLPLQIRSMRDFTVDQVLSVFLMLRIFVTYCPTSDASRIIELEDTLEPYLSWPLPVAGVATDLVAICQAELRAPGTLMRRMLALEVPELHPGVDRDDRKRRSLSRASNRRGSNVANGIKDDVSFRRSGQGAVHVFVDADSRRMTAYSHALGRQRTNGVKSRGTVLDDHETSVSRQRDAALDVHNIRCRVLTHIFDLDFLLRDLPLPSPPADELDAALDEADPLRLRFRAEADVEAFYREALAILEKAASLASPEESIGRINTTGVAPPPEPRLAHGFQTTLRSPTSGAGRGEGVTHARSSLHVVGGGVAEHTGGPAKWFREAALGALLASVAPGEAFALRRTNGEEVRRRIESSSARRSLLDVPTFRPDVVSLPMRNKLQAQRNKAAARAGATGRISPHKGLAHGRSRSGLRSPGSDDSALSRGQANRTSRLSKYPGSVRDRGKSSSFFRRKSQTSPAEPAEQNERPISPVINPNEVKYEDMKTMENFRRSRATQGGRRTSAESDASVVRAGARDSKRLSSRRQRIEDLTSMEAAPARPMRPRAPPSEEFAEQHSDRFGGSTPWGAGQMPAPQNMQETAEIARSKTRLTFSRNTGTSPSSFGVQSPTRDVLSDGTLSPRHSPSVGTGSETEDMLEDTAELLAQHGIDIDTLRIAPPPPYVPVPVATAGFESAFRPYFPEKEFHFHGLKLREPVNRMEPLDQQHPWCNVFPRTSDSNLIFYDRECRNLTAIFNAAVADAAPPTGVCKPLSARAPRSRHAADMPSSELIEQVRKQRRVAFAALDDDEDDEDDAASAPFVVERLPLVSDVAAEDAVVVRIAIMGSVAVLHRFCVAYADVCQNERELCSRVRVLLHVLPGGQKNGVAKFLAQRDKWYRRHVYRPFFRFFPLVPHLTARDEVNWNLADEAGLGNLLPMRLARQSITDYVRFGEDTTPVVVWECYAWKWEGREADLERGGETRTQRASFAYHDRHMDGSEAAPPLALTMRMHTGISQVQDFGFGADDDSQRRPSIVTDVDDDDVMDFGQNLSNSAADVCIPFVTSADIGLLAQAELHRMRGGLDDAVPLADILCSRDFQDARSVPELQVSVKLAGVDGSVTPGERHIFGSFPMLSLSNLPLDCEPDEVQMKHGAAHAALASPSTPTLSLFSRKDRSNRNQQSWRCQTPDEARSLLDALQQRSSVDASNMHVVARAELITTRKRRPFHVMLDGVVFGPFQRARFVPKLVPGTDRAMALNLQSFLPTER